MDRYTIKKAYIFFDSNEIAIQSENLDYVELGTSHHGCQVKNSDNKGKIKELCSKVVDLIREIDNLNKIN